MGNNIWHIDPLEKYQTVSDLFVVIYPNRHLQYIYIIPFKYSTNKLPVVVLQTRLEEEQDK